MADEDNVSIQHFKRHRDGTFPCDQMLAFEFKDAQMTHSMTCSDSHHKHSEHGGTDLIIARWYRPHHSTDE